LKGGKEIGKVGERSREGTQNHQKQHGMFKDPADMDGVTMGT
jgi:hypothetical protein